MKIYNKIIFTIVMIIYFASNGYSIEEDRKKTVLTNDTIQARQIKQVSIQDTLQVYTCSMHPEVISKKPGNCPKCGMELVLKNSASNSGKHKMGMMDMMHGGNHHSHGWMYVAGGAVMAIMMAVMIL
jgi:hypothetical protein